MSHLHDLRIRLVDCRATYRQTKDIYDLVKAEATQRAQPIGKNAEERAVSLTLALNQDAAYQTALGALREAETAVERAEANLETARDERRAREWQIRQRLADGLFRAGVQSEASDDEAFDDTADSVLDNSMSHGNLNSTHYAGQRRPQPTYSMLNSEEEEIPF